MGEVRFSVRVRPAAGRTRVGGAYGDDPALVVAVTAPPVDGAANDAVCAAIARAFGIRRARVRVVSGHISRTKVIGIGTADDEAALRERLAALLG